MRLTNFIANFVDLAKCKDSWRCHMKSKHTNLIEGITKPWQMQLLMIMKILLKQDGKEPGIKT